MGTLAKLVVRSQHLCHRYGMEQMKKNNPQEPVAPDSDAKQPETAAPIKEYGGPKGLEPTRYGDWERGGRVSDF
jgi:hypothetical protein